jgi:cbb3-type cytochrome oxidase subunit 3
MKYRPTRISPRHPKRLIIAIVAAVFVFGLATYGVFSYLYWREFNQNSQQASRYLKSTIESSLGSDDTTPVPSAQIDIIVTDFEKNYGTNPCEVSIWYSWQTIITQIKDMQNTCEQRFAVALDVISTLKPLSIFLQDEKKAADLMAATIKNTKTSTDYTAVSVAWQATADSTELSTNNEFKVVHAKYTEVSNGISAAYATLASATSNENKAAFDTASTNVQTAYTGIDQLKIVVDDERMKLITVFINSYEKL